MYIGKKRALLKRMKILCVGGNYFVSKNYQTYLITMPLPKRQKHNQKNPKLGKKEEQQEEDRLDDSTTKTSNSYSTESENNSQEEDEWPKKKEGHGKTPSGLTILLEDASGKSRSTITENNIKDNGLLTVIQKSQLMNWAEENFLRKNKITTYEEAIQNKDLHKEICRAMEIGEDAWATVGSEAIKKLRSAMSDRVCQHRKIVKSLYISK